MRILALVLILASTCSPLPTANGQEKFKDREALELFERLFPHPDSPQRLDRSFDLEGRSLTSRLLQMHQFLENNPVSPTRRQAIIDLLLPEGEKPQFTHTISSAYFTFRFTQSDPEASHNIGIEAIDSILTDLDSAYLGFLRIFRKIDPAPPLKQSVDVYNFTLDPRFQVSGALAYSTPEFITINILPSVFNDPCVARATLIHELFHRVEKAHRAMQPGVPFDSELYWLDGMAEYAVLLVSAENAFMDQVPKQFADTRRSLYGRSYDSVLFWLYLDERSRELNGAKAAGKILDRLLNRVDKSGRLLHTFLPAEITRLYRAEQKKKRGRRIPGAKPDAAFFQEWHITNLFSVLGSGGPAKLTYREGEFIGSDACGTTRGFPPLQLQADAGLTANDTPFGVEGFSGYGGASYYGLRIADKVTETGITVNPQGPIVTSVVGVKGRKVVFNRSAGGRFDRTFKFKPGSVDTIFVVIGGADSDRGADVSAFTLSVNGGTPQAAVKEFRVRMIATISDDPNIETGDPVNLAVTIAGKTVLTQGPEEGRITIIPEGSHTISADVTRFGTEFGGEYRVGFVTIAFTRSGQVWKCPPTARIGNVDFPFLLGGQNPDSQSDFVVGVRVVPLAAEPLTEPTSCDIIVMGSP